MKKTAKEWYQHLPEPIRSQAVANWEKSSWVDKHHLFEQLRGALHTFSWDKSPQRAAYWSSICARAERGEFDQPEPNLHGWIPVAERLPTIQDSDELYDVMALTKDDVKKIVNWIAVKPAQFTHWQPLPKLPEVKGGENV